MVSSRACARLHGRIGRMAEDGESRTREVARQSEEAHDDRFQTFGTKVTGAKGWRQSGRKLSIHGPPVRPREGQRPGDQSGTGRIHARRPSLPDCARRPKGRHHGRWTATVCVWTGAVATSQQSHEGADCRQAVTLSSRRKAPGVGLGLGSR